MTHPGLGVWAVCTDYDLEHQFVPCTPPFGETGAWQCCIQCALATPADPADG